MGSGVTAFNGWGDSWGNSWGSSVVDPNALRGATGFSLTAVGEAVGALVGQGNAALTFGATGTLTALIAELEAQRRPRSHLTLKLTKLVDGKTWARGARSSSKAAVVRARGVAVAPPQPIVVRAVGALLHSQHISRARSLRSVAASSMYATSCRTGTAGSPLTASACAAAAVRQSVSVSLSARVAVRACSRADTLSAVSSVACERARARGVRNLSNAEIVAVVRSLDKRV